MIVINLSFGLDALAVFACQRQFFLGEKTNGNVAHLGGCYSPLENTLDWIEERSECSLGQDCWVLSLIHAKISASGGVSV